MLILTDLLTRQKRSDPQVEKRNLRSGPTSMTHRPQYCWTLGPGSTASISKISGVTWHGMSLRYVRVNNRCLFWELCRTNKYKKSTIFWFVAPSTCRRKGLLPSWDQAINQQGVAPLGVLAACFMLKATRHTETLGKVCHITRRRTHHSSRSRSPETHT
jgi:hypothetical protein